MSEATTTDQVHLPVTKPSPRFGPYNVVCWMLAIVMAVVVLLKTLTILAAVGTLVFFFVAGLWKEGSGNYPNAFLKWLRKRAIGRNDGGFIHHRFALSDLKKAKRKQPNCWDVTKVVEAHYFDEKARPWTLPLAWTPDNDFVTVYFDLGGAPVSWLDGDTDQKMAVEQRNMAIMRRALSTGPASGVTFGMTIMGRPSDVTEAAEILGERGNPDIVEAADELVDPSEPSDFIDESDRLIGSNMANATEQVYVKEDAQDIVFVGWLRTPWPRVKGFGKRIKLNNPKAFQASHLWRRLVRINQGFQAAGVGASLVSAHDRVELFSKNITLTAAPHKQTWAARDRQLVRSGQAEHIDLTPGARDDAWLPSSTRYLEDEGLLCVDGTYIASGYVNGITTDAVSPGALADAFDFGQGVYWTYTLICRLRTASWERHKAREKEFLVSTKNKLSESVNGGISNEAGDDELRESQEGRSRIKGGNIVADWSYIFSVLAPTAETARIQWDDCVDTMGMVFELARVTYPEEIVDIVFGHLGVKSKQVVKAHKNPDE